MTTAVSEQGSSRISGRGGSGGAATGTRSGSRSERAICAFFVGDRCFGLEIDLVGEIYEIESITEVPLAQPSVLGVFNLRGAPVPLLDLSEVLGAGPTRRSSAARVALVLRLEDEIVALAIDRMQGVVPAGRGAIVPPSEADDPLVAGFLEPEGQTGVVTVISEPALREVLDRMRFTKVEE